MNKFSILFAFIFLSLINNPGFGQSGIKDTLNLGEIIITATKASVSIGNVTQKIDVLPASELTTIVEGNNNIAEAIQYQPGVSVSALSRNDANWGTYGGIGPKYNTYMLSGLPVDAFVDPQSLDLSAIERIEIQRGPASVLYPNYLSQDFAGNQSPLAGTVNLVLKEKFDRQKTLFSSSIGSYHTFNGQLYHQDVNQNLHYFAGLDYEMSDYTNYGTENSWLNMKDNPEYKKTKLYLGVNLFVGRGERQKVSFFINRSWHNGDAGRVYRGFENDYTTMNAGYTAQLSNKISLNTHFGLRIYDRKWQESHFNVVDSLLSNNGVYQNILPADIYLTIAHGNAHSLIFGADYQGAGYFNWNDPLTGVKQYGNKSNATQTGIYAQEELRFGGLIIRGGLRYNFIRHNIDLINGGAPGEKEKSWSSLIWSGGVKYHLNNWIALFGNAGNSYLTPGLKSIGGTISINDLGVEGRNGQLPNPDLKPESGLGADLGLNLILPADINLSVRAFYLRVDDAIVETVVSENPSQSQSVNAGESSSTGVELDIYQQFIKSISWFANYTYMQSNIKNPILEDQDDVNIPFAPEHIANAGIKFNLPFGLLLSPYLNYNGGYFDSNSKSGRKKFTPGVVANVYVSQKVTESESSKFEIFARLYNITDNRYEMPWQFQNTGFSFMAGLTYTFF
ncbi:MAG: TonB-dependent receptor [Bacteroidales bacterium]|nr:TonB-dependent receptor [Bacteroidales bacterium]